jgi:hypothetical protein
MAGLCFSLACTAADSTPTRQVDDRSAGPVPTVKEIMTATVIPSSNALFEIAMTAPTTDDDWRKLQTAAETLTGSANQLLADNGSPHRTEEPWVEACRVLVEAGHAARQAAIAKDADRLLEAGDRAYQACEQCHKKYFPRPPSP